MGKPLLPQGGKNDPFFRSQFRFAFFPSGKSNFEDNDSDGRDINVVEAFAKGGNFGSPLTYWAGKRFYRDVDLYIFDWYYFAAMSGNGAGIGNIPLGKGTLAAAFLFETGSTRTNLGQNQVQVLDLRWFDVKISNSSSLNFWASYGTAPGGNASGTEYVGRSGWLGGLRWRKNLWSGFNDLTVVHGQNILQPHLLERGQ